jgi:putative phage-type endonuclease
MSNISLPERRQWVGASESAALFGVSPYLTRFELYHLKAGNIPPADLDGEERIEAGRHLEPAIAAWAADKWQWPLHNVTAYLRHPSVSGMGCSLDFETADGEPVEIKNVDNLVFRDGDWVVEGDVILDAPAHFLIQVTHQLACRPEAARGWLLPCVGGNRLYRMEIPRHEKMVSRIEREVTTFWQSVEAGEEPRPDFEADAAAIAMLYGGRGDEVVDLRDDARVHELCAAYLAAHEVEKEASGRKKAALAEIKTLMQDARCAMVADGYKVKASHIKGGTYTRDPYWRFSITQKKEANQ